MRYAVVLGFTALLAGAQAIAEPVALVADRV